MVIERVLEKLLAFASCVSFRTAAVKHDSLRQSHFDEESGCSVKRFLNGVLALKDHWGEAKVRQMSSHLQRKSFKTIIYQDSKCVHVGVQIRKNIRQTGTSSYIKKTPHS